MTGQPLRATLLIAVAGVSLAAFGVAAYQITSSDDGPTGYSLHQFAGRDGDLIRLRNDRGGVSLVDLDETPVFDCRTDCDTAVARDLLPVPDDTPVCLESDQGGIVQVFIARPDCFGARHRFAD